MLKFLSVIIAGLVLCASPASAKRYHHHRHHHVYRVAQETSTSTLPHPAGCPRSLFCGCGVSVDVFGHPVRNLYLAIAWAHNFNRASPASGMVAARSGHVMRLRQHVSGDVWMVYDPNGGRGRTWLHARSIRGYIIVDPHSPRNSGR